LGVEIETFMQEVEYTIQILSEIDEYEKFDPNSGIYERFGISLIGVVFELVTAISLIWLALPVAKLMIAFHSSEKKQKSTEMAQSTSTPNE